jgi:hypothetical protein
MTFSWFLSLGSFYTARVRNGPARTGRSDRSALLADGQESAKAGHSETYSMPTGGPSLDFRLRPHESLWDSEEGHEVNALVAALLFF